MKVTRTLLPPTRDACRLLGQEIAIARRERRMSARELAERVGVSPDTLRDIERGKPTVAIGVVFEAATILGIQLFGARESEFRDSVSRRSDRLALLPKRVRARPEVRVSSDF